MEKFDCNLKCPFFLHTNFPMVLNDQKLFKRRKAVEKGFVLRDPKCILIIYCSFLTF